jgi:hypothetical protein
MLNSNKSITHNIASNREIQEEESSNHLFFLFLVVFYRLFGSRRFILYR